MVRRVDRNGEALIGCRKRSGYARQSLGAKLVNRCKPEKKGYERVWTCVKRI